MAKSFDKKSGAQLGFYYQSNAKVWMTMQLYQDSGLDSTMGLGTAEN
jgi:hypothetical protein